MKEKSKILKLKKKYNKYLWFERNFSKIAISVSVLSGIIICSSLAIKSIPIIVPSIGIGIFVCAFSMSVFYDIFQRLFNKQRAKIDDKIEILIKSDAEEKQILDEYMAIQKMKKESKQEIEEKNKLITRLIHKKNFEAKEYNDLVKSLTKKKKREAEQEVIEEIEMYKASKETEKLQYPGYSRTSVAKIYAEKSKEQNEEIQNSIN